MRLGAARVWVVDPIDGTNSFVEGRPEFVVSVGLVEEGRPSVAVVYNPATGELYHARAGARGLPRRRPRLRVSPAAAAGRPPVLLASRTELERGEFAAFQRRLGVVPLGSTAYRMVKVAEGAGHAFFSRRRKRSGTSAPPRSSSTRPAAGRAQLDGAPLRFNRPEPALDGVVATGGIRHRASAPTACGRIDHSSGPGETLDDHLDSHRRHAGRPRRWASGSALGAPGWPGAAREQAAGHTEKRPINPIAWGRTSSRERLRPRRGRASPPPRD